MQIRTTLDKISIGLSKIRAEGGDVSVNGSSGSVSIQGVEARFDFEDGVLFIEIIDMPFFVSESFVENKIREFFN